MWALGQASRFADLNQLAFQQLLADRKISLHSDLQEQGFLLEALKVQAVY